MVPTWCYHLKVLHSHGTGKLREPSSFTFPTVAFIEEMSTRLQEFLLIEDVNENINAGKNVTFSCIIT